MLTRSILLCYNPFFAAPLENPTRGLLFEVQESPAHAAVDLSVSRREQRREKGEIDARTPCVTTSGNISGGREGKERKREREGDRERGPDTRTGEKGGLEK